MDGHAIRLSMGEPERKEAAAGAPGYMTVGSERQWLAGNVAVYGAFDAPEAVQERLRTVLAPLAAGRGRAVWEYGCARAEQEGPLTGGVTTYPSRVTLCARTQPATFSLLVPPDRLNEPVQLEFSALRPDETEPVVSVIWQWQNESATRISDALPFIMDLPATGRPGSFSITVTGSGPVAIRIRSGQR